MHRKAPAKRGLISLSSIPQIYRNFNRWTEIISILSKYGLADWLSRLPIEFAKGFIKQSWEKGTLNSLRNRTNAEYHDSELDSWTEWSRLQCIHTPSPQLHNDSATRALL